MERVNADGCAWIYLCCRNGIYENDRVRDKGPTQDGWKHGTWHRWLKSSSNGAEYESTWEDGMKKTDWVLSGVVSD